MPAELDSEISKPVNVKLDVTANKQISQRKPFSQRRSEVCLVIKFTDGIFIV
jgi:hypothetical protein